MPFAWRAKSPKTGGADHSVAGKHRDYRGGFRTISIDKTLCIPKVERNLRWTGEDQLIACHHPVGGPADQSLQIVLFAEGREIFAEPGMRCTQRLSPAHLARKLHFYPIPGRGRSCPAKSGFRRRPCRLMPAPSPRKVHRSATRIVQSLVRRGCERRSRVARKSF